MRIGPRKSARVRRKSRTCCVGQPASGPHLAAEAEPTTITLLNVFPNFPSPASLACPLLRSRARRGRRLSLREKIGQFSDAFSAFRRETRVTTRCQPAKTPEANSGLLPISTVNRFSDFPQAHLGAATLLSRSLCPFSAKRTELRSRFDYKHFFKTVEVLVRGSKNRSKPIGGHVVFLQRRLC